MHYKNKILHLSLQSSHSIIILNYFTSRTVEHKLDTNDNSAY